MTGQKRGALAVALSGGTDSAVAACLLKEKGFEVKALTMLVAGSIPGANEPDRSAGERGPEKLAGLLDIEHHWVDLRREFEEEVVTPFLDDYARGLTPNPCVTCNRRIKFGSLLDTALARGCEALATGHYVRLVEGKNGRILVRQGVDGEKDQSYVFWSLSQDQLHKIRAPLGEMKKGEVRDLARESRISEATLPESQDICFLEGERYTELVSQRYPGSVTPGPIVDTGGKRLGIHRGIAGYTVGQRRGLGISHAGPLYVVQILPETNSLVVGEKSDLTKRYFHITLPNFVAFDDLTEPMKCSVMTRYRSGKYECVLYPPSEGRSLVELEGGGRVVAPGQSAVFYQEELLLGGGIIARDQNLSI